MTTETDNSDEPTVPVVMVFAGTDSSGGAGVQADIETLASMGCHAAPVITAITVQDTVNVKKFEVMDATLVVEQARAVLEDMPISAIKIGMVGSVEIVEAIHTLLIDYSDAPVVLDPIIESGSGSILADEEIIDAMADLLFPLVTLLTPNSEEARRFAPEADNLDACAQEILESGCEYVLITGTHENTRNVENRLYADQQLIETFSWERLPDRYHGSGCTMAMAITGLLSQGVDPFTAILEGQEYTWEALRNGYRIGMGQLIPNRLFWARGENE